jgi:hypothetical protein
VPKGTIDPINCISTTTAEKIDFTPTGFSRPQILGGFPVMP